MEEFSHFIDIIKDFILLFDSLISIEQTKLDAAVKNRVSFVEDCMNKEQAAILRLRGLEQKREQAQRELGMEHLKFREILDRVPPDVHEALKPLFDQLSEQVRTFQSVSDSAKDMIELNLHVIQSTLAPDAGKQAYSQTGSPQEKRQHAHFTDRSI